MDKEIKEIIDKIKRWCDLALDDNCNTIMYKYELVSILDYITNLEQEIEEKKNIITKLSNKLNMIKENIDTLSKERMLDIIEYYTGFWGKPNNLGE